MTDIGQLLADFGIRRAVVIDDAFDEAPRSNDLDADSWTVFFDDIASCEGAVSKIYPKYAATPRENLQSSDEFIAALWEHRGTLPKEVWNTLFEEYKLKSLGEREKLNSLVAALTKFGLDCTTCGREFTDQARDADLVFIDLFLGFWESESDMGQAIDGISELVLEREATPPLVVLMSRSPRLMEKRNEFRDKAGLLSSTFRVVSKTQLEQNGELERLVFRLANHYEDAKRVAGFVHAWNIGLGEAQKRFIQVLRRLDLPDLGQIRALMLDFEGQKLGEYLLDVADRVLQHEIEADAGTITAALELDKIDLGKYPAPHLAGSPDLQDLVHRMVYLHINRLQLSEDDDKVQLQFGDVLRWKAEDGATYGDDVSLVVTPACDLVRNSVARVMLLSGKLEILQPKNWSYRNGPVRTAIVILPDEERYWIRWNLKDVKTLSWNKLDSLLCKQEKLKRIGRLREIYAIEIQQMLLANFGRVGSLANLPVPFPVSLSLYYVDTDSKARKLDAKEVESAVCYVGRDANSEPVHRLVLTEQACDCIELALQSLASKDVHASAQASLEAIKKDQHFFTKFERGEIEISSEPKGIKLSKSDDNKIYVAIIRGDEINEGSTITGNQKKAALLVKVTDVLENSKT